MKYWILILLPFFLVFIAPEIRAHNLVTVNGSTQEHRHVYRRQEYGKPLQQGHVFQSQGGGSGMILWGTGGQSDYGKSTVRRSGPIIGDRKPRQDPNPDGSRKYGSTVNGYGKPVRGYGKPGQ